jgi:hypothetical protein
MPDRIIISITDDLISSGKKNKDTGEFKLDIESLDPSVDVSEANNIAFTDNADLSAAPLIISKVGKGDGQADTFNFDLSNFDDSFDLSIKSEGPEDSFIIDGAISFVESSGVYTITYTGADGGEHTATIDPGIASMIINIVCFTPEVHLKTPDGLKRVSDLEVGDLVSTLDHGAQRVRWIGRRHIVFPEGAHKFKPILISKGAIDGKVPKRDVLISPQHRILWWDKAMEIIFFTKEVLVPAKALIEYSGIHVASEKTTIEYISVMFDRHEIIEAEGMMVESFLPRPYAKIFLPKQSVIEIEKFFPGAFSKEFESLYPAARTLVSVQQAKKFIRSFRTL